MKTLTILAYVLLFPVMTFLQSSDDTRQIRPSEFVTGRRPAKKKVDDIAARYRPRASRTGDRFPLRSRADTGSNFLTVGVTIWRSRRATVLELAEPKIRKELLTVGEESFLAVAERLSSDALISDGDLIQIGIEYMPVRAGTSRSARTYGVFLYVVSEEEFPDGKTANPKLIFPTKLTFGGDNRILPARIVTLPQQERPFRIVRGKERGVMQSFEVYSVIISTFPLSGELPFPIGEYAMSLNPELISSWESRWGRDVSRADLIESSTIYRSQREVEVGPKTDQNRTQRGTEDTKKTLAADDPLPQSVFRRTAIRRSAILARIKLKF